MPEPWIVAAAREAGTSATLGVAIQESTITLQCMYYPPFPADPMPPGCWSVEEINDHRPTGLVAIPAPNYEGGVDTPAILPPGSENDAEVQPITWRELNATVTAVLGP